MRIRDDYVFGVSTAALTAIDTTLSAEALSRLVVVTAPDIAAITLHNSTTGVYEIVHVTAHTAAATTATILRAQEGSTAQAWPPGTTWLHGATSLDLEELAPKAAPALTGAATLDGQAIVTTNDTRLADSRTPSGAASGSLAGSYPGPSLAAGAVNSAEINAAIKDAAAATASLRTLGTGALQAAAGNDARLSDARTPLAHTHVKANITDFAHTHLIADLPTDATVPAALGTAAAGTAATVARRDHVHPLPALTAFGVTATAAELNILDGALLSTAELNYVDGVTSAIQTQINGKAETVHGHALTDANITGIIPDALLPSRLRAYHNGDVPSNDLNLATETGVCASSTALNAPGGGWWLVEVVAHNSIWVTQTAHQFTGDNATDTTLWRRACNNGTWEAWYRLRVSEVELDARYTNKDSTATAVNRAMNALTGGGNITVDGSYNLKWTSRFITMGGGRGTHWSTVGYYDINMPPAGTVITGYGGAASQTVTAAGIPLVGWAQLFYEPPIGGSQVSDPARFRLVAYTANFVIPDHWVFLAIRGEGSQIRLGTGHLMNANMTATVVDPYPMYAAEAEAAKNTLGGDEATAVASGTSGTVTLNCDTASVFTLTPTAAVTALSITNPPASGNSCTITLVVTQPATAYAIATPVNGVFFGAATPTQVASKKCLFTYHTTTAGASWHCSAAVQV